MICYLYLITLYFYHSRFINFIMANNWEYDLLLQIDIVLFALHFTLSISPDLNVYVSSKFRIVTRLIGSFRFALLTQSFLLFIIRNFMIVHNLDNDLVFQINTPSISVAAHSAVLISLDLIVYPS